MDIKQLREQLGEAYKRIKELRDRLHDGDTPREFTAEERQSWEAANADYDRLKEQIEHEERFERLRVEQETVVDPLDGRNATGGRNGRGPQPGNPADATLAFSAWARSAAALPVRQDEAEACARLGFSPTAREIRLNFMPTAQYRQMQAAANSGHSSGLMSRAMSVVTGSSGGVTVGETFLSTLEVNQLAFGGIRQAAGSIRTDTAEPYHWPNVDDTSNEATIVAEGADVTTEVDASFNGQVWYAHKFKSGWINVSRELLEDSAVDIAGTIGEMFGQRFGRGTNTKFTTGTGAGEPMGIMTTGAAENGVTAASATAIVPTELVALIHSVDPAYRTMGCKFMMHDNVLLHLRQLQDGDGNFIWRGGLEFGVADKLLGYEYVINQAMASSVATTNKTVLFGDLSRYKIRTVRGMRLHRADELKLGTDQVAFIAFLREDGNLLNAGTCPCKYITQA